MERQIAYVSLGIGAHVEVGQAFAELEVMKMYLPVHIGADGAGVLRWRKKEGLAF